jgi:Bacterial flagellin C-terminal helical region
MLIQSNPSILQTSFDNNALQKRISAGIARVTAEFQNGNPPNTDAFTAKVTSRQASGTGQLTQLTAAQSKISDVDSAVAVASKTQDNILQQAGSALLAQANQTPPMALSLLTG